MSTSNSLPVDCGFQGASSTIPVFAESTNFRFKHFLSEIFLDLQFDYFQLWKVVPFPHYLISLQLMTLLVMFNNFIHIYTLGVVSYLMTTHVHSLKCTFIKLCLRAFVNESHSPVISSKYFL